MAHTLRTPHLVAVLPAFLAFAIAGCASTKTSNTSRTAMEQLLISNAVDQSLNRVDFQPLAGRSVFLDTSYVDCVDKNYIIASSRDRILQADAKLVGKAEDAEVIVEVRTGAVGTDQSETYVGVPELALPGPIPVAIPQLKLWSKSTQTGTAKIGLVAYEAKSRQMLGRGGTTLARSDDSNTFFFGMGPYQSGSVRSEVSRQLGRPEWHPIPEAIAFGPLKTGEPARLRLAASDDEIEPTSADGAPPPPATEISAENPAEVGLGQPDDPF